MGRGFARRKGAWKTAGDRSPKSEVRSQRSGGNRGQRTVEAGKQERGNYELNEWHEWGRGQGAEVRSQRSEVRGPKSGQTIQYSREPYSIIKGAVSYGFYGSRPLAESGRMDRKGRRRGEVGGPRSGHRPPTTNYEPRTTRHRPPPGGGIRSGGRSGG